MFHAIAHPPPAPHHAQARKRRDAAIHCPPAGDHASDHFRASAIGPGRTAAAPDFPCPSAKPHLIPERFGHTTALGLRGLAQLVEHRSPKPRVVGSSPSTPARPIRRQWRLAGTAFLILCALRWLARPARGHPAALARGAGLGAGGRKTPARPANSKTRHP